MMRPSFRILLTLLMAIHALADEEKPLSLDELIASVTRPVPTDDFEAQSLQRRSFEVLRGLPAYSAEDDAKIVTALQSLRTSADGNLSNDAPMTLGARRHRELLPEYFDRLETEPHQLRTFFFLMSDREKTRRLICCGGVCSVRTAQRARSFFS